MKWALPLDYESRSGHANYTGWIKSTYDDHETFIHYENGVWTRDLGPAAIVMWKYGTQDCYFWLDERYVQEDAYWRAMYKKYRTTEHEGFVVSHMLGTK
jgi:hypothetical protein